MPKHKLELKKGSAKFGAENFVLDGGLRLGKLVRLGKG